VELIFSQAEFEDKLRRSDVVITQGVRVLHSMLRALAVSTTPY
jgi:hypothetical protein